MYQGHRRQTEFPVAKVTTVEFQAGKRAEPSPHFIEILRVDIHSDDPLCGCVVYLLQAIAARYSKHSDAFRTAAVESALEKLRQCRQLAHSFGAHVPFIIFEGYSEPRI